jgi:hypothetical protein
MSVSAPQLSEALSNIVDSDTRVSDLPVVSDWMKSALNAAIVDFEMANTPADPDEITRMIGKIAVLYPNAKLSDAEAKAQNELYVDLLSDIPGDILARAFRKCAQTLKFFPTVAEIRSAAMPEMAMRSWRIMRMKALVKRAEREPLELPKQVASPDERQTIMDEENLSPAARALLDRIVGTEDGSMNPNIGKD